MLLMRKTREASTRRISNRIANMATVSVCYQQFRIKETFTKQKANNAGPQRKPEVTKYRYCRLNETPARVSWYGLKLFGSRCRSAGPAHPFYHGTPS